MSKKVNCPYYKEKILENATKCRHCYSELENQEKDGALFISSENMFIFKKIGVIIIALISVIITILAYLGYDGIQISKTKKNLEKIYLEAKKDSDEIKKLREEIKTNISKISYNFGDYLYFLAKNENNPSLIKNNLFISQHYNKEYKNIEINIRIKDRIAFSDDIHKAYIFFKEGEGFVNRLEELEKEFDYNYKFGAIRNFKYSIIILNKDGTLQYGDFYLIIDEEEMKKLKNNEE